MNDEIDIVRRHRPEAEEPTRTLAERAKGDLMEVIEREAGSAGRRRRVTRGRLIALGLATLALAGGAYAALRSSPETLTQVVCVTEDGQGVESTGASGDPIADCSAWWSQAGQPIPRLRAYSVAAGIAVVPVGVTPPEGAVALPREFRQDLRVLQLDHELYDVRRGIDGIDGCLDVPAARRIVDRNLERLGLVGWSVAVRSTSSGSGCARGHLIDGPDRRVTITAGPPPGAPDNATLVRALERSRRLSGALEAATGGSNGRCMAGFQAEALTARLAASMGMDQVRIVRGFLPGEPPDGRCVRASVAIFGTYFVYLDLAPRAAAG